MKVERIPPDRRLIADSLLRWQRGRLHGWIDRRPAQVLLLIMLLALLLGIAKLWLDPPNIEWELQNRWWQIALNVAAKAILRVKPFISPSVTQPTR
jgi:hypothetical protein